MQHRCSSRAQCLLRVSSMNMECNARYHQKHFLRMSRGSARPRTPVQGNLVTSLIRMSIWPRYLHAPLAKQVPQLLAIPVHPHLPHLCMHSHLHKPGGHTSQTHLQTPKTKDLILIPGWRLAGFSSVLQSPSRSASCSPGNRSNSSSSSTRRLLSSCPHLLRRPCRLVKLLPKRLAMAWSVSGQSHTMLASASHAPSCTQRDAKTALTASSATSASLARRRRGAKRR